MKNGHRSASSNLHGISEPMQKRLYTLPEAAHYLGQTVWGMRQLVWSGKIPYIKYGRKYFFDVHDMDKFIDSEKITFA